MSFAGAEMKRRINIFEGHVVNRIYTFLLVARVKVNIQLYTAAQSVLFALAPCHLVCSVVYSCIQVNRSCFGKIYILYNRGEAVVVG